MAETNKTLELRNAAKKKKYTFIVKESKFSSGVKKRWRFPRGKHSQVRQMHKGKPPLPGPGYGSPAIVRGLDKNGLRRVVVSSIKDLEGLDLAKDGVVLSRTLGARKSVDVLKKAQDQKLQVLNVADIQLKIKTINDAVQARKKKRLEKLNAKTKKKKDTATKAKSKESAKASSAEKADTTKAKTPAKTSVDNHVEAEAKKSDLLPTKQTTETIKDSVKEKISTKTSSDTKSDMKIDTKPTTQ